MNDDSRQALIQAILDLAIEVVEKFMGNDVSLNQHFLQ